MTSFITLSVFKHCDTNKGEFQQLLKPGSACVTSSVG